MRFLAVLLGLLCAAGCSREVEMPPPPREDPRSVRLESRVAEIERLWSEQAAQSRAALGDLDRRLTTDLDDLEKRFRLRGERLAQIENRVRELEGSRARRATQAEPLAASGSATGEPRVVVQHFEATDPFPIRITDVRGGQVVTGRHTSTRMVETGRTYIDEFGQTAQKLAEEEVEVNEYGYEVTFSAENVSDQPCSFRCNAGLSEIVVSLQPGETAQDLAINAALGGELTVQAGGYTRRYAVTY